MNKIAPYAEQHVESLVRWYQQEKSSFATRTYLNEGNELQRLFKPFKDWDNASILNAEADFSLKTLTKLHELVSKWEASERKPSLALLILCLKNRSEYASNQSDFYPVYAGLIAFAFTLITLAIPVGWKVLMGFSLFIILAASFKTGVETRRQVAHIRELINILESYKSEFLSKSSANAAEPLVQADRQR